MVAIQLVELVGMVIGDQGGGLIYLFIENRKIKEYFRLG
jgi:hypothetical protein